jgi:hypothetical protein
MSVYGPDWQMFLAGVQIPYLRDVYDHVVTLLHRVEAASDTLVNLQNTYLANVQIDVAEASNDANTVMKVREQSETNEQKCIAVRPDVLRG